MVVIGAVIVYGYYSTISIIAEALYGGLCAAVAVRRGLDNTYQQASVVVIIGNGVANGLSGTNTLLIIAVGIRIDSRRPIACRHIRL